MDSGLGHGTGSDSLRGELEISTKRYKHTKWTSHLLSFPTNSTPLRKVGNILKLIMTNGLQNYLFSPEGEGCRFWVYTFVSNLEREGLLESGSAAQTRESMRYYYIHPAGRVERVVKEGKFVSH